MVKKKAKKQSKGKKTKKEPNIRTDVWQLAMTQEQRQLAILTVAEYRHFLKPLVLISYWNWGNLSGLNSNERVNTLEKLIHSTVDNLNPKYSWYFLNAISNHPSFRKFPSYLRRAAIQDALGIVSSFVTRWDTWKRGERKHRYDKPPKLTAMCNSYPTLYKGQQVKYHSNFTSVELKVWNGTDWVWMQNIPVKKHGKVGIPAKEQNSYLPLSLPTREAYIFPCLWYAVLTNSQFTRVWEGKSSSHTLRTPVTLSTLWELSKA